jgi:hypothetical protein
LRLESLLAEVPSVIVPEETNLLLNPLHPAHGELKAEIVRPWVYDARLRPNTRAATARDDPPKRARPGRSRWGLRWPWRWCRSRLGSS